MTKGIRTETRVAADNRKLTWHSDSDSDDYGAPLGGAPKPGENRNNRVVVLKGMFLLEDLEKEPELLIELKEEVREEAATLGEVTSVILYDVSGQCLLYQERIRRMRRRALRDGLCPWVSSGK